MRETIPASLAGERVDRIVAMLVGCSRAEAAGLVADGSVLVGGLPVRSRATRVAEGEELEIEVPAATAPIVLEPDPTVAVRVVFEDEHVLVVDKPPGLVVHPGAGNRTGTLVQGIIARYPEISAVGDPTRPGIVHRLDKDTSGLLVVARSAVAYAALVAQLSAHDVERGYLALVWGHLDAKQGMVDAPIGRSAREPTRMAVSTRGREARTRYEVQRAYDTPVAVSLVACRLETGRTHQIRVHLAAIGHAVVGDTRYGGVRQSLPVPRVWLHAAHLAFEHPVLGGVVARDSAVPPDLEAVLSGLR